MERYLLDTNIVLRCMFYPKELDKEVLDILENPDYTNRFYVSAISIQEIGHLYKRGKIKTSWKRPEDILPSIEALNFDILPVKREHVATFLSLSVHEAHNDPSDHIIISQAITEKMTLVSSDRKFEHYTKQRLSFIFNSRS